MVGKSFDNHRNTVGEKIRVSFIDAKDTIVSPPGLDKPPSSVGRNSEEHLETTQVGSVPLTVAGYRHYRLSSRIEDLAKPLARRLRKPLNRPSAVLRGNRTLAQL